jgi:hypothetical protein
MKLTALALAALLTGASVAAPVLAADSYGFDSSYFLTQLRYDGINAIEAEDYSDGRARVLVQLDDGSKVVQFFDKDSFQLVTNG